MFETHNFNLAHSFVDLLTLSVEGFKQKFYKYKIILEKKMTKKTCEEIIKVIDEKKHLWIKKKIKITDLSNNLEELLFNIEKDEEYEKAKNIIEDILLLDENIDKSTLKGNNIMLTMMVAIFTIYGVLSSLTLGLVFQFLCILIIIGIMFATSKPWFKHIGKYPREITFYQILLKRM